MTSGMMHLAAAGVISLCCLASPARAEMSPGELAGRWVSATPGLVLMLDISRCGNGWCGVQVNDGACAHTALRLEVTKQYDETVSFKGTLLRAVGSKPYRVGSFLLRREGALSLSMMGNGGGPSGGIIRRSFEFVAVFARTGEATCAVDPKVT